MENNTNLENIPKEDQSQTYERISCQYCEDVGTCSYCDRGRQEEKKKLKKIKKKTENKKKEKR
jgi:hypothetical protein